jgi:hypothetical protein
VGLVSFRIRQSSFIRKKFHHPNVFNGAAPRFDEIKSEAIWTMLHSKHFELHRYPDVVEVHRERRNIGDKKRGIIWGCEHCVVHAKVLCQIVLYRPFLSCGCNIGPQLSCHKEKRKAAFFCGAIVQISRNAFFHANGLFPRLQ